MSSTPEPTLEQILRGMETSEEDINRLVKMVGDPLGGLDVIPEAKDLESLDKVVSSENAGSDTRNSCFRILHRLCKKDRILPESYHIHNVVLCGQIPHRSGRYADIWKGEMNGSPVRVKAFRFQFQSDKEKIIQRLYPEILQWKHIEHPNLVPLSGISETPHWFSIISPWYENGDILEYISNNGGVNRLQLLAQAAHGLQYLHSNDIVHGNINPGNILIGDDGTARLADFKISSHMSDPNLINTHSLGISNPGAVHCMAPELLAPSKFQLEDSNPTKQSDIYSLAMTTYQVLTGTLPYGNAPYGVIISHVIEGTRPPHEGHNISENISCMITECWDQRPARRWDIGRVCNQFLKQTLKG